MASVRFLRIPTCCIRLANSTYNVQHSPPMLDSTMLDDVGSVWPGLKEYFKFSTFIPQFQLGFLITKIVVYIS